MASRADDFDDTHVIIRKLLDLAIATQGSDSPKLTLIGWAPTAPPTSNIPGQPRNLKAIV